MRLSKTAWLILGAGIFIIAFATLYMVYSRRSGEQEQLNSSLAVAQGALPQLISEREDLESQLTQWESQLTEATSSLAKIEARFPESVQSIEYDERLFELADDCDLEITSLTASEPSSKKVKVEAEDIKVEDITYATTSFRVEVRGEVDDILDFINAIATGEHFITATVESVDMDIPEPEEGEEAEKPTATIELVIYGYEGE